MKPKGTGKERASSATVPAVIDTPFGPILIYRLAHGKIGVRHPPQCKVLRKGEIIRKVQ